MLLAGPRGVYTLRWHTTERLEQVKDPPFFTVGKKGRGDRKGEWQVATWPPVKKFGTLKVWTADHKGQLGRERLPC